MRGEADPGSDGPRAEGGPRQRSGQVLGDFLGGVPEPRAREVLRVASAHLNRLMEPKFRSGTRKLGDPANLWRPLATGISASWRVEVCDACGVELTDLLAAADERFVLALSMNFAERDVLGSHEPIVVDGGLRLLDRDYQQSCCEAIAERPEQRVVLEPESVFRRVGVRPDFNLVPGEARWSEVRARGG